MASDFPRCTNPALAAFYQTCWRGVLTTWALMLVVKMREPLPCFRKIKSLALATYRAPFRSTSMTWCQSSMLVSNTPALAGIPWSTICASMHPKSATIWSTIAETAAASVTSHLYALHLTPYLASISFARVIALGFELYH